MCTFKFTRFHPPPPPPPPPHFTPSVPTPPSSPTPKFIFMVSYSFLLIRFPPLLYSNFSYHTFSVFRISAYFRRHHSVQTLPKNPVSVPSVQGPWNWKIVKFSLNAECSNCYPKSSVSPFRQWSFEVENCDLQPELQRSLVPRKRKTRKIYLTGRKSFIPGEGIRANRLSDALMYVRHTADVRYISSCMSLRLNCGRWSFINDKV